MMHKNIVALCLLIVLAASCGGGQAVVRTLPVMRDPIKLVEGGEMWEKTGFAMLVDGSIVYALSGGEKGLVLSSMRQDGAQTSTKLLIPRDEAWWSLSEGLAGELCGDDEIFEEKTRIVLGRGGILRGKEGFLVAFGAENVLSCKSSRKETLTADNYFLAAFDDGWNLTRGPWKARSGREALAFIPVRWQERAGFFWLTETEMAFILAPESFEGEGELHSRPIEMNVEPEWGRSAVLAAVPSGEELALVAAYLEEISYKEGKNSVTTRFMKLPGSGEVITSRLKMAYTPTAVELQVSGDKVSVLWALTGRVPPAGTITSVLKADLKADGSVAPPETIFEKKDMAGSSFLVKKVCGCTSGGRIAVAWVFDAQGMDGMEERIGLFTSKPQELEAGRLYQYTLKIGQRGVKDICISPSGSQYVIIWEERGLHQIRTAIPSI
jgi:hypothetical protein